MKVRWIEKGRSRWIAIIAAVLAATPQFFFPLVLPASYPAIYPILLAAVLGVFALLVFGLRVEVNAWWGVILEQACIAGASACIIHLPLYAASGATIRALLFSAFIFLVPQFLALAITGNGKWFGAVVMTVCWIYGIINFEVFEFTENMISWGQILSVQTGINVMSNYRFVMGPYVISSTILYICAMAALIRFRDVGVNRKSVRLAAVACAGLSTIMPVYGYLKMPVRNWQTNALYHGIGIPLELMLECKSNNLQKPEGYSAEAVSALAQYADEPRQAAEAQAHPHVIAVMIEAFSDLSVLGDIETNVDPIPNTRALAAESIHGYFLASTFAGGTSRTEWEFLTGNSMYFVPISSIPFKQYISGEQNSIVRVFKNAGYHTIGMHCFDGNGWNRDKVYPWMGFDDIYFEDDLEWDERVRKYISDRAFMHQIIRLFEDHQAKQTGEPLFLFGVTMQNHGDYEDENFEADVHVLNVDVDCSIPDQYLSLTRLTDNAIKELVDYFRGVDEPVEIVLFGDHQPYMPKEFFSAVGMKEFGRKYMVPYVIWRNYDSTPEETGLTSANYLSARTLRESGLNMPAYYRFLDKLSETLPALCGLGYQYEGAFYDHDAAPSEAAKALLNEYAAYQYANLMDLEVDRGLYNGSAG